MTQSTSSPGLTVFFVVLSIVWGVIKFIGGVYLFQMALTAWFGRKGKGKRK